MQNAICPMCDLPGASRGVQTRTSKLEGKTLRLIFAFSINIFFEKNRDKAFKASPMKKKQPEWFQPVEHDGMPLLCSSNNNTAQH